MQVPDGLSEIVWLATHEKDGNGQALPQDERLGMIAQIADSIYGTITSSPGCLAEFTTKKTLVA